MICASCYKLAVRTSTSEKTVYLIHELFSDLPRQAPGYDSFTRKAYEACTGLPEQPRIADIGCGAGIPTLELARISGGAIVAVDNYQPYLDTLGANARKEHLADRIQTLCASMFELDFEDETFDLVWSEGAIYIYGFTKGLHDWKRYLKPGGYMVASEITWLKDHPPFELQEYWTSIYSEMGSVADKRNVILDAGYELVDTITLPSQAWWDSCYTALEKKLPGYIEKHADVPEALQLARETEEEIEMFRKYSDYYGYVFYITKAL